MYSLCMVDWWFSVGCEFWFGIVLSFMYIHLHCSHYNESLTFLSSSLPPALLLSAIKYRGYDYTPALIKRVIEKTATPLGSHDPFSIGHGVIQVL